MRELVGKIPVIESSGHQRTRCQQDNPSIDNQPPVNHHTGAYTDSGTVNRIHVNTYTDESARVSIGACGKGLSLIAVVYTIANQLLALLITVPGRTTPHIGRGGWPVGCRTEAVSNRGPEQGARHRHGCSPSPPGKVIAEHPPDNTPGNRSGISVVSWVSVSHPFDPAFIDRMCDLHRFVQSFRLDDFCSINVARNCRGGGDGTARGQHGHPDRYGSYDTSHYASPCFVWL